MSTWIEMEKVERQNALHQQSVFPDRAKCYFDELAQLLMRDRDEARVVLNAQIEVQINPSSIEVWRFDSRPPRKTVLRLDIPGQSIEIQHSQEV